MIPPEDLSELQQFVKEHRVCFDVWPLREVHRGELQQVGFEIDLIGAIDQPGHYPSPGSPECEALYKKLRRLATAAIPEDLGAMRVEILEFDASFHESKQRGFREDVELQIMIMHRLDHELPLDSAEVACVNEIKAALRTLGVHEGRR